MRLLPSNRWAWFALLPPFQVYIFAAPIWLYFWGVFTQGFRTRFMYADQTAQLAAGSVPCFMVFIIAGIIQFWFGRKHASLVSFGFAITTYCLWYYYMNPYKR